MKKRELKTKTQFKEALSYIKESQTYIYVAIGIFVISAIFGFVFHENLTFLNKIIEELILKTQGLSATELIFFILQNNLMSSLLSVAIGLFFGIFPVFNAIVNGVVLGYVSALVSNEHGLSILWRLLPHGIFELPAIFISLGLGIKLGFTLFLGRKTRAKEFRRRFYNSANTFLMIVIPLLIIAALIEGLLIAFAG